MSIFIDKGTKILVQGITGKEGSYWTKHMKAMGTCIVAGVTPSKEGQLVEDIPVYHTVRKAVARHDIEASMLFVPPRFTKDAVLEALDAGIKKIVTVADGIPLHDTLEIRQRAKEASAYVIGGNTSGVISPGKAMMGFFPYWIERVYKPGRIGIMTRSGSLTNEVTSMVVSAGFGVSTLMGIGGDPVPGTRFVEMLPFYEADHETDAVVIIGELGGTMEEEVATAIKLGVLTKPLVAFLGGRTAPKGKKMGHAGAIITGGKGSVESKTKALEDAGAFVAKRPRQVGSILQNILMQ
ncbi:succinate--CoA ligase subunit alpha [Vallitalea pronyensis]|uniref:Succinate--CoA ligase subunit alpha n=1 Tax=Vallitalea pronyensis TaxID=1348613 RepID=A0A8J8SHQ8_9FIRM|nr:succinate--CoA ligase subunit alpha [Vallitalea pronyensis]QUI23684.1 succinate--CoA ligase subunit alpha [Vallitalea pronyensis]